MATNDRMVNGEPIQYVASANVVGLAFPTKILSFCMLFSVKSCYFFRQSLANVLDVVKLTRIIEGSVSGRKP